MEESLTYLQQRANHDWLMGYDSKQFHILTEQLFQQLTQFSQGRIRPKIIIAEQNPQRFLAAFLAAVAAECPIFLCNPHWVEQEWQSVLESVQPNLIFGQGVNIPNSQYSIPITPYPLPNHIMIPTGGSSGNIRFAIHTWETLIASVRGFYHYFGGYSVNSFCVLPLYHVSGLMQFMRSFTTGGRLMIQSFKQVEAGEEFNINPSEFFISLVPTQLQRCLQNPQLTHWLSRFKTVLLGGAPAWDSLLEEARCNNIRLAPTYGMTETASQVVTLKPEDFLAGNNSCGQLLPHAKVTIRSATGEPLGTNQTGIITIQSDSLALGYYPSIRNESERTSSLQTVTELSVGIEPQPEPITYRGGELSLPPKVSSDQLVTAHCSLNTVKDGLDIDAKSPIPSLNSDDLGFFDDRGYLNIVGRRSRKIITGGENVFPAEVEAAIQATQLVTDVCVTGIPDQHWGQAVTAVYVPQSETVSATVLQALLKDKLSKYKQPKHWIPVVSLPRNAQGKVDYEKLQTIVMRGLEIPNSSLQRSG